MRPPGTEATAPLGLEQMLITFPQGSSCLTAPCPSRQAGLATLGYTAQRLWRSSVEAVNHFAPPFSPRPRTRIPTGFRPPAQGCAVRGATLGNVRKTETTPTGLRP